MGQTNILTSTDGQGS